VKNDDLKNLTAKIIKKAEGPRKLENRMISSNTPQTCHRPLSTLYGDIALFGDSANSLKLASRNISE
jgi:hypothetical protein